MGEAFRRIARRLQGEKDVPFVALETAPGFWTSVKRWMGLGAAREVAS